MKYVGFRLILAISAVIAVIYGCGGGADSPMHPAGSYLAPSTVAADCGAGDYLVALSPLLAEWQDSLNAAFVGPFDDPPTYVDGANAEEYLGGLVPVLEQWEMTINLAIDPVAVDTVPAFDPASDATPQYLLGLSALLDGWKAVIDAHLGAELLSAPPVFQGDMAPPMIVCPADMTVDCTGSGGAIVEFADKIEVSDDCDLSPDLVSDPASGTMFPLGSTMVTCTTTDSVGNTSQCTFMVTVQDTTPPVINEVELSRETLWPPNHQMVKVEATVDATDVCDETPHSYIYDVTSDEEVNGPGDGNTEPDWVITGDLTVKLRSERSGLGDGRWYYIHVRCVDSEGNAAEHMEEVWVPHDLGE